MSEPLTPVAIALAEKAKQVIEKLQEDKRRMLWAVQRIVAMSYDMHDAEFKTFCRGTLADLIKEMEKSI